MQIAAVINGLTLENLRSFGINLILPNPILHSANQNQDTMARSRRQQKIATKDKREGKRILNIFLISTLALLALMYVIFQTA
ncbi:MAG: hypothetical protein ACE362_06415 [Phaeodactylibacter xiamenensis]|uniref:Uncharacterized protein n=1 Tax=Phaeodactylibacter xiamenensis TaxID=1524460 RepID=A0A098RZN5_9BACT|nr:hypothetical protein IX84_27765 [Phaeodactylibacter xiamenensis]MCR9052473.1 hypothetical protein [bacterium]